MSCSRFSAESIIQILLSVARYCFSAVSPLGGVVYEFAVGKNGFSGQAYCRLIEYLRYFTVHEAPPTMFQRDGTTHASFKMPRALATQSCPLWLRSSFNASGAEKLLVSSVSNKKNPD